MELVYLWVEDYKNIQNEGFNFSPKFECTYNQETKELTIKDKEHLGKFFGENINVTAIVGENGSGKSSILDILELIYNNKYDKYILIQIDTNNTIFYTTMKTNLNVITSMPYLKNNSLNVELFKSSSENSFFNTYKNKNYLHSNQLNKNEAYKEFDLSVIQIGRMIANNKYSEHLSIIFDFIPIEVKIKDNYYFQSNIKKDLKKYLTELHNSFEEYDGELLYMIEDVIDTTFESYQMYLLSELIKNSKYDDISSYIYALNENGFGSIGRENIFFKIFIFLSDNNYFSEDSLLKSTTYQEYNELLKRSFFILNSDIKYIFNKYQNFFIFDYLDENGRTYSSLSHGEKVLLGQIISFQNKLIYKKLLNYDYIFLIDEPDIALHPQWQKKYLQLILENIKRLDFLNINIHLILSSHSPFIISDLPKENIIFLKKDKKTGNCINATKKTDINPFGANIHTLLSHGFFMEDGLMGEFAKGKINEIKEFYDTHKSLDKKSDNFQSIKKDYESKKKNFKNIHNIIGEPFLKTVIGNYLDELEIVFYGKKEFLKNEIARLQEMQKSLDA